MTAVRRRWLRLAGLLWLVVICALTLRSAPAQVSRIAETPWSCLVCGEGGATDVILNLLLFIPLGVLAHALGVSLRSVALISIGLTVGIELSQGTLLDGRDASVGDVVANSLGGIGGWFLLPLLHRMVRPSRTLAWRGAIVTLLVSQTVWMVTGAGLRPALSRATPWVGQQLHQWPAYDRFPGVLNEASIGGVTITNEALDGIPPALDALNLTLGITRTSEKLPARPASILRVVDAQQHVQVSVSQHTQALMLEVRLRSDDWLLRRPAWRFDDVITFPADARWRFHWTWKRDHIELMSGPPSATGATTQSRSFSVASGWVFLHPFLSTVGPSASTWTALWLWWWFGLLAWFAGALGPRSVAMFGLAGVGGLVMAGAVSGIGVAWSEVGIAVGAFGVVAVFANRRRLMAVG